MYAWQQPGPGCIWFWSVEYFLESFTGRTSGTPSHGYPADTPGESSTIWRCNGSGRHARQRQNLFNGRNRCVGYLRYKYPRQQYTPLLSKILGSLDTRYLVARILAVARTTQASCQQLTQVHNVVSTDSTVIHDNIPGPEGNSVPLEIVLVSHHHDRPWLPRCLSSTFFTSNFFLASAPSVFATALPFEEAALESFISTSAIIVACRVV